MTPRDREIDQDVKKIGNRLETATDPVMVVALQKLFIILQIAKGVK
jgi:hypothetical protein